MQRSRGVNDRVNSSIWVFRLAGFGLIENFAQLVPFALKKSVNVIRKTEIFIILCLKPVKVLQKTQINFLKFTS